MKIATKKCEPFEPVLFLALYLLKFLEEKPRTQSKSLFLMSYLKKIFYSKTQGSHAILKVLNFKIGFQDLERVLNLAKMYIRY